MKKCIPLMLILVINCTLFSQTFNKPVPLNFHQYEFLKTGNSTGFYVSAPFYLSSSPSDPITLRSKLYILNNEGYLVWYHNSSSGIIYNDFKLNNNELIYTSRLSNIINNNIVLDTHFNPIDTLNVINAKPDAHEFIGTKEKGYLISGRRDSIMDLSAYVFNGVQGDDSANVIGYVVQEFDSNKNLIFEWNTNDYIHPTEMVDGYPNSENPAAFDYAHGNSIDKDTLGNYYLSLRHTNSVIKIDANGNLKWRFGGKLSDFTFANDSGFSGQHDARILPNGNISLFDNTNTSTIKNSRGVEYSLDTNLWVATRVKEYTYTDSIYAIAMGNYQLCSNGDRVLNFGLIFRPAPSFIHLDSNGNNIAEVRYENRVVSYRSFYYESLNFMPQLLTIDCKDTVGGKYLTAPSGYTNYMWSTGDTAQNLFVSQSGEYQVWYNYGIGMLGSNPIYIDINVACDNAASISSVDLQKEDIIIAIYNVLGEKLPQLVPNQVNIIRYQSGKFKKSFITQ